MFVQDRQEGSRLTESDPGVDIADVVREVDAEGVQIEVVIVEKVNRLMHGRSAPQRRRQLRRRDVREVVQACAL